MLNVVVQKFAYFVPISGMEQMKHLNFVTNQRKNICSRCVYTKLKNMTLDVKPNPLCGILLGMLLLLFYAKPKTVTRRLSLAKSRIYIPPRTARVLPVI